MLTKNTEPKLKLLTSTLFSRLLYKTRFSNRKGNQFLLSVDVLKDEVRRDLLNITTQNIERIYQNLLDLPHPTAYLEKNGKHLFLQLIKKTCEEFLTQQYGHHIKLNKRILKTTLYTETLLQDCEILFEVPFYSIVNPNTPYFKKIYYPIYSYASESFIESLLDNLVIEISNCIVYFSLVTFSFLYTFRQTLYRTKFLSLRNFERFRNNIIWQLRVKIFVQNPIDLYHNRYKIFILRTSGLYCRSVYANRTTQLTSLSTIPLTIISVIEIKDFLISRLDELIYLFSKGVRFTLTSVVGQVIGLIWRGVIDGLKK